jgi:hypothetical protein
MLNKKMINILNKIGDIDNIIEDGVTLKQLIEAGYFNNSSLGQIISEEYGPYQLRVGDEITIEHYPDIFNSRLIQIYVKDAAGKYILDSLDNYSITFDSIQNNKTVIRKLRIKNDTYTNFDKLLDTKILITLRKNEIINNVYYYKDTYVINNLKEILSLVGSDIYQYVYCIDTKSIYQWKNNKWEETTEKLDYKTRINYFNNMQYQEIKKIACLQPKENFQILFSPVKNKICIVPHIIQYDLVSKKIINSFSITKDINSLNITNESSNACQCFISIYLYYENDSFIYNNYKELLNYFVTKKEESNIENYFNITQNNLQYLDSQKSIYKVRY